MAKLDDLSKTYILAQYCKQAAMAMRHKFSSGIDFAVECPFCGTKNPGGNYCLNCGKELANTKNTKHKYCSNSCQ